MQKIYTRFTGVLLGLLGLAGAAGAQTTYSPVPVTGFTQDVIANGTGSIIATTTSDMDNGAVGNRFCFVGSNYVSPTGATPINSLPLNGIINNLATPGNTYKLESFSANNSLRITNSGGTGTLTLSIPQPASAVYLLGASGNGISTFTATVNFTDGSSQAFTGRTLADWFGGANPVVQGVGRANYDTNALQSGTDPRLYEVPLALLTTNYAKTIQSIGITKTSTLGALNIMAVSLAYTCPTAPAGGIVAASAIRVCAGTSVNLSLSGAATGLGITYQWQASTNGGITWADVANAMTTTLTAAPTVTTQYRVRVVCGASVGTSAVITVTVVPPDVASLAYGGTAFCQAGSSAVPTASPTGGTFSGTPGLVINATTGVINLASSTVGAHTVTYTSAGFCPAVATVAITLTAAPTATIAYGSTSYCQAATNPTPTTTPAGGTFSSTPGLVLNATTGAINLPQSTPGNYTVTYTVAGACATPGSTTLHIEGTAAPIFYNVITPNGDAKNDYLAVSLPSVTGYNLQVYNRWGTRIWESADPGAHWAAEGYAAGTYYYWVRFADCSGQAQSHRGWVEVVK